MIHVMTPYKQGDIILIPFPFSDLSTLKQRPAFVISSDSYNKIHADIIICAITSHIPKQTEPFDYKMTSDDIKHAGLPKESLIKLDKIVTIDKRLVRKKLGSLPRLTIQELLKRFDHIIN
jgi:mRNA interferase MazF